MYNVNNEENFSLVSLCTAAFEAQRERVSEEQLLLDIQPSTPEVSL